MKNGPFLYPQHIKKRVILKMVETIKYPLMQKIPPKCMATDEIKMATTLFDAACLGLLGWPTSV